MKKTMTRILCLALVLVICASMLPASASAASTKSIGFPLPIKSTPYEVTVLSRYSYGTTHMPYIYEYGALKNQTADLNIVMDISVAKGTEVYAVADGKITTVAYGNNGGHYVVIKHTDGSYSYYGHLNAACLLKKGSTVSAGQLIGYSGNSGAASTGAHLHFEWSGHDPFCAYSAKGLVKICSGSGASKYPHTHSNPYAENTSCSHDYSGGVCKKCGHIYKDTVTSMKPTAFKVTKSGSAPVWSRPYSNNSEKLDILNTNTVVIAVGKTVNQAGNTWYLLSDGSWIYAGNVKSTSMPKNVRYITSADGLNLRSSANTSSKVLTVIPTGGFVTVNTSKTSGSWIYVNYPADGISGWVSSKYLSTSPVNN